MIYDEVETFRPYDDEQFDYPYGLRKTSLDFLSLNNSLITRKPRPDEPGAHLYYTESQYDYQSNTISF